MKKLCYEMDEELLKVASQAIRNKKDLSFLLFKTINFLVTAQPSLTTHPSENKKLVLYIDKMSRLIFCTKDKIFTFQFPFKVLKSETEEKITIWNNDACVDNMISSIILSLIDEDIFFGAGINDIEDFIVQHLLENDWDTVSSEDVCEIVKTLFLFEPGYLRYDYDEALDNGRFHPKNHIDFFYTSNNQLKLGLDNKITLEWMLNMLDIHTECVYLK